MFRVRCSADRRLDFPHFNQPIRARMGIDLGGVGIKQGQSIDAVAIAAERIIIVLAEE